MISKIKPAPFSRIIPPWSAHRYARPLQKMNFHGRSSWAALRLVWRMKRNRSNRTFVNSRHIREFFRIELKQFHRFTLSTNHQVEIRRELAMVPQHKQASSRYVHFNTTNIGSHYGNGNPISVKAREQLKTRSTLERHWQSRAYQQRVTKSDFLTRVELKLCIQKQAKDPANPSNERSLHQDTVYRRVSVRRENEGGY